MKITVLKGVLFDTLSSNFLCAGTGLEKSSHCMTAEYSTVKKYTGLCLSMKNYSHSNKYDELHAMKNMEYSKDKGNLAALVDNLYWYYSFRVSNERWGKLTADYKVCGSVLNQSPIDMKSTLEQAQGEIFFKPYNACVITIKQKNNSHTIKLDYVIDRSATVFGKAYKLEQMHFHVPVEHTINGDKSPMELHLVHKSPEWNLAVVGVFMKQGKENKGLRRVWKGLPGKGKSYRTNKAVNAMSLLPKKHKYNFYIGSLKTPPCIESVKWFVMSTPVRVSSSQINEFRELIGKNAQPVQAHNSRIVRASR